MYEDIFNDEVFILYDYRFMNSDGLGFSSEVLGRLLHEYRDVIRESVSIPSEDEWSILIDRFCKEYSDLKGIYERLSLLRGDRRVILYPVEAVRCDEPNTFPEYEGAGDFIRGFDSLGAILAFDSSSHSPRGHGLPDYILVNVGYHVTDFVNSGKEGGSIPYLILMRTSELDSRILEKYVEHKLFLIDYFMEYISRVMEALDGRDVYLFFDESFNLSYTYALSAESRSFIAESFSNVFKYLDDLGVVYGGVFYTSSSSLTNQLRMLGSIERVVRDSLLINRILDKPGYSWVFRVESEVLSSAGIELYTSYVKVGVGNVIRVEFPKSIYESGRYADLLKAVYLDSLMGNGYPYSLQQAHFQAVLRRDYREAVESMIADTVGIDPWIRMSRKLYSKRTPVV